MKAMGKNTAKISCFQKNQKIMLTLLRESAKLLESRKKTEKDKDQLIQMMYILEIY